jgi:ATP-dependent DNA helicase RecG
LCSLSEGLNEGLSEGLKRLFKAIQENQGIQAKDLAERLGRPIKTIERQIKTLTDKSLIERRGSKKTGGYWIVSGLGSNGKKI